MSGERGRPHEQRALNRLREGHLADGIEDVANDGDGQLCAIFALADSMRNDPALMLNRRIRGSSGRGLALALYASVIRASERIRDQIGMRSGNRDTFSADQLQAGLDEFAQGLQLGGITLGTVEYGRPGGRRVLLQTNADNAYTLWIGHHLTPGGATWRGIRGQGERPDNEPNYTGTVDRIRRIEALMAARGVRFADMTFDEGLTITRADDLQMPFRIADVARRLREEGRGQPSVTRQPPATSQASSRLTLRALRDPQALVPGLPSQTNVGGRRGGRTSGGHRGRGGQTTRPSRTGRVDRTNPAGQGLQFTRRGHVDPREATEDMLRLIRVWTGPEGQPQLIYPGPMTYGRWTVLQFPNGERLVPFYLLHGPQEWGALTHTPDEVVYTFREMVIALVDPDTDQVILGHLRFILDTHNPRIQLTLQHIWRMADPGQAAAPPHPLVLLTLVILTRGTRLELTVAERAQTWGLEQMLDRRLVLRQDEMGRLVTQDGLILAGEAFPYQLVDRRYERNTGRRIPDREFIDQHESRETEHWNLPRLLSQAPTPDQERAVGPLPEGYSVRFSYGDGYLRSTPMTTRERSTRPYSHLMRDATSMQFAESNGASTDADILDFDEPIPGEEEFYRDQRIDEEIILGLLGDIPEARRNIGQEVLAVVRRVLGPVQSRMAMVQTRDEREIVYRRVAQIVAQAPGYSFRRAFLNINNREPANNWMAPVIDAAVMQLVGPTWQMRLRDRISAWTTQASTSTINLRDAEGRVRGERARVPAPERRQEAHEAYQQVREARRAYLERAASGMTAPAEPGPCRTVTLAAGVRRPRDESRSPPDAENRRRRLRMEAEAAGVVLVDVDTPSPSPQPHLPQDRPDPGDRPSIESDSYEPDEPRDLDQGSVDPDDLVAPWNRQPRDRGPSALVGGDDATRNDEGEVQREDQDHDQRTQVDQLPFPNEAPAVTNEQLLRMMRRRFPNDVGLVDLIAARSANQGDEFQDEDDGGMFGNFDGAAEEYMPRRERERSATAVIMDEEPAAPTPSRRRATSAGSYSRHL